MIITTNPLKENGTIHGAALFITDITEKATLEIKKHLYQTRQIAISQTIPDFFVISSSDGYRKHVNKSYCDFFEFDSREIIGQNYFEAIPPTEREEYLKLLEKITPDSPSISTIHLLKNKRGIEQWTLWNETGIFDHSGNFVEIVSIGRNINDIIHSKKEREEYINVLEKAIFKTSHEIRQPITNIIGVSNLINSDRLTSEEIKKTITFINQSAEVLDKFTHEMNSFINLSIENHKNYSDPIPNFPSKKNERIAEVKNSIYNQNF